VIAGFADWKFNDFFYSDDSFSVGKIKPTIFDGKVWPCKMFLEVILVLSFPLLSHVSTAMLTRA